MRGLARDVGAGREEGCRAVLWVRVEYLGLTVGRDSFCMAPIGALRSFVRCVCVCLGGGGAGVDIGGVAVGLGAGADTCLWGYCGGLFL